MSTTGQFTVERFLNAQPEKVWAMWTTAEGLEKWWGPQGFRSVVQHLDVRPGGRFELVMTAFVPQIIEFLKRSGMGASNLSKGDYTEVETNRRLAYTNAINFVPGVAPYTATTRVELAAAEGGGTRLTIANDVLHDERWTQMARAGWGEQLGKLEQLLG